MLEDKGRGNEMAGQPGNGLPDEKARGVGKILTHADAKRPRRKALAADVVRKVNEIRVITINGIISDIRIKKHSVAEQEVSKDQRADGQEAQTGKQEDERQGTTPPQESGRDCTRP